MTRIYKLCLLLVVFATAGALPVAEQPSRRVNGVITSQIGFAPPETKWALLLLDTGATAPAATFTIKTVSGSVRFTGTPEHKGAKWAREVWRLDFSTFKDTGTFSVHIQNYQSQPFKISPSIWSTALPTETWFNSFFARQRMTGEEYPNSDSLPQFILAKNEGKISVPGTHAVKGGWQDAHSDDQHLSHSGMVSSFLYAWELDSLRFKKASGAKFPSILDEARWGLVFQLSMQNPTGSFGNGLTISKALPGGGRSRGVFIDSSITLAAQSAAALAHGARIFRGKDNAFADTCLNAAKKAWNWSITHNDIISIGLLPEYWNAKYDARMLAALELWRATGEKKYRDTLETAILRSSIDKSESWQPYWKSGSGNDWSGWFGIKNMLGSGNLLLTYGSYYKDASPAARAVIKSQVDYFADRWSRGADTYGVLAQTWVQWFACMGTTQSNGATLAYVGHMLNDTTLLRVGADQIQAVLGRNPMGKSYVRGVGSDYWNGEWAKNLDNTWGAIFPGIILSDSKSANPASEGGLPTDNCAITGNMGSSGWRCGEWVTGYTSALILGSASLNAHYNPAETETPVLIKPRKANQTPQTKMLKRYDLMGRIFPNR